MKSLINQQQPENILIRRIFPTSPQRLFDAWTDPALLAKWWGPPGSQVHSVEVDLQLGGSYRIGLSHGDGEVFFIGGKYETIQPPHKLTFTWRWELPDMDIGESQVTLEFQARGKATELILTHAQLPNEAARSAHEEGWVGILESLGKMVD